MESQRALLEVVEDQKKTIEKYTSKLRDVVAAHKSLLSEKKALEDVVKTLSAKIGTTQCSDNVAEEKISESSATDSSENGLKNQLSSLTAAISSLVAEKSQMEIGFKSKQKQLLEDKEKVENKCEELEQQIKALTKQLSYAENKTNSESFQQKKNSLISLRSSKQTNDKDRSDAENELLMVQIKNYEQEIKNLKIELEAKQIVQESSEKKLHETSKELNKLQEDFKNLHIEHEIAISSEKEKARNIEEGAKKLTAVQEKRVYNLEARLAELSETIGTYDRLRLQDQMEIQKLKEHIAFIDMGAGRSTSELDKSEITDLNEYESLKEKFVDIVKNLKSAAQKYNKEEDIKNLMLENSNNEDPHVQCKEEYAKLESEFECFKKELRKENGKENSSGRVIALENEIINLKQKIKILGDKNNKIVNDYNFQIAQLKTSLKNEKKRFKKMISASEADHKARVCLLEEQLQKQRERSLALLEEKDQEIQALQSSFQKFLPGYRRNSEDESQEESNILTKSEFDGPHIVHYANELARKDIEISSLRKSKQQIEAKLRILEKEAVLNEEKHKEEKNSLLSEIKRVERSKSEVGENVEYLRFVVYSFLKSDDPKWKSHLCKAIVNVLKFTDAEREYVIRKHKYK